MNVQSETNANLQGKWLLIARLAWAVVFLTLSGMYAFSFVEVREALSTVCKVELCTLDLQIRHTGVGEEVMNFQGPPFGFADRLRPVQVKVLETLGLTLDQYGWLGALQMGIPALIFLLIAAGLFWRKSNNWMALFVSVMVATTPIWAMPLAFTLAVRQPTWEWVVSLAFFVSQASNLVFPLIFPTGRFVPRWTRWMLPVALVHAAVWSFYRPLIDHPRADEFIPVTLVILGFISLYAQVYRYFRAASPLERQQLKWLVVGYTGLLCTSLLVVNPLNELLTSRAGSMDPGRALILSAIFDTLSLATTFFSSVAIVIAILRYRLWDVDIFINRTLVYGALTASVIGIYVVVVGVLGTTVQSRGNLFVSILATGLVAVLVQPLRDRLQRGVNRMMYGERDDPVTVLSRLGQRLEGTLAPDAVLPSLVETVAQTLKLPYVAIETTTTRINSQPETASASMDISSPTISYGFPQPDLIRLPLVYQSETIGQLVVSPRAPGEALSPMDRHLLENIAHQAGMAVHAVNLTADLQRSRQHLVTAREEERRRLRRDLHDGLGPNLASQGLKLAAVKQSLESNPSAVIPLLDQIMAQNKSTVDEVRHLVYGLRPPALDELGLVAAIRDYVAGTDRNGSLQIEIAEPPDGLPPLSAAVEVAAYRIILEALTNVIRHAEAKHCAIRFSVSHNGSSEDLQIEIKDDGKGMPQAHRAGVGLRSMRERAEELGGMCVVESNERKGTCVSVSFPLVTV